MTAAACYGLVAFLLAIGQCESGRRRGAAVWFAMSRSVALVAAVELLQLFTIAHVADPRDLVMGWFFSALGAGVAWSVLSRSVEGLPRPVAVLRGLVMVLALALPVEQWWWPRVFQAAPGSAAMNSWLRWRRRSIGRGTACWAST